MGNVFAMTQGMFKVVLTSVLSVSFIFSFSGRAEIRASESHLLQRQKNSEAKAILLQASRVLTDADYNGFGESGEDLRRAVSFEIYIRDHAGPWLQKHSDAQKEIKTRKKKPYSSEERLAASKEWSALKDREVQVKKVLEGVGSLLKERAGSGKPQWCRNMETAAQKMILTRALREGRVFGSHSQLVLGLEQLYGGTCPPRGFESLSELAIKIKEISSQYLPGETEINLLLPGFLQDELIEHELDRRPEISDALLQALRERVVSKFGTYSEETGEGNAVPRASEM